MKHPDTESILRSAFHRLTPDDADAVVAACAGREQKGEVIPVKTNTTTTIHRTPVKRPHFAAYAAAAAALLLVLGGGAFLGLRLLGTAENRAAASGETVFHDEPEGIVTPTSLPAVAAQQVESTDAEPTSLPVVIETQKGDALTLTDAKDIALQDAGVTDVTFTEGKADTENGIVVYEFEFHNADWTFEYEIDCGTGRIVYAKKQWIGTNTAVSPTPAPDGALPTAFPSASTMSDADRAYASALLTAGVDANEANLFSTEHTVQNSVPARKVTFVAKGYLWEYTAAEQNGSLMELERESYETVGGQPMTLMDKHDVIEYALQSIDRPDDNAEIPQCELDVEDSKLVYEIELLFDDAKYELEFDAQTLTILKQETEPRSRTEPQELTGAIGADNAAKIAINHAGVNVAYANVSLDRKDGRTIYDIEFVAEDYKYGYEIDAYTGTVLKAAKERTDDAQQSDGYIGESRAKEIALSYAGVSASDAKNVEVDLDRENSIVVYDVDFDANGYEYDYEIDAATGAVLKADKEKDDDAPKSGSNGTTKTESKPETKAETNSDASYIGTSRAKSIALNHAGVSTTDAKKVKVELGRENGKVIYEVDFEANGYEYDYEIDATTGAILKVDKEKDD